MKYVKSFTQANYNPRIEQMANLILQMVDKSANQTTNTQFTESSSVLLALPSTVHTKPNQHLNTIKESFYLDNKIV